MYAAGFFVCAVVFFSETGTNNTLNRGWYGTVNHAMTDIDER